MSCRAIHPSRTYILVLADIPLRGQFMLFASGETHHACRRRLGRTTLQFGGTGGLQTRIPVLAHIAFGVIRYHLAAEPW